MSTIQYSATTGEPFLRLPAPFSNIIVTPPRMSDVEPSVAIMGDPAVAQWMGRIGPGSTYTTARAEAWLTALKAQTDAMERADGTDVFIGDVGLVRSGWTEVLDTEQRGRFVAENNARAAGDPAIAWHVGYYLAPSHHGRGLMTIAVKTLITQFGIPLLKTKRIRSSTFQGNYGSLRVLQKNGFVIIDTLVEHAQVGDEKKSLHLMEWLGADSMIP
ncbi:acyl-CoA N-acyltransferase [Mycena olivaceomarginata]|nr:acyl-CoA N-acyltransferase [Mycena olivaceomarginata]